jgi:hypothetical protein
MNFTKALSLSVLALVLTACGGSGSSDSGTGSNNTGTGNNGGSSNNGSGSYVSGQFKNSGDTGEYYIKSDLNSGFVEQEFGSLARKCVTDNNDYYFESDRTMVFGSRSLDKDTFKRVATLVEDNLDGALSLMSMTYSELIEERSSIATFAIRHVRTALPIMDFYGKPDNYDDMSSHEQMLWGLMYFDSLSKADQVNFAIEAGKELGMTYEQKDVLYKDKVYVCLNESGSTTNVGEGNRIGLSLSVPVLFNISGLDELVTHELIHTAQYALVRSLEGGILPKWFVEGQAVYLSGQSIAQHSDHSLVTVPNYVSSFDQEHDLDIGELYRHYGLAYKYLQDANGTQKMKQLLGAVNENNIVYHTNELPYDYNFNTNAVNTTHSTAFIVAFDEVNMLKKNSDSLIMNDWVHNYHTVMETH